MRDFVLKPSRSADPVGFGPGNVMMVYLTAHRMQSLLGFGQLANFSIPMFGIDLPDQPTAGAIGMTDDVFSNGRNHGLFPFAGFKNAITHGNAAFLTLDGYCQNISNFYDRWSFDYEALFPSMHSQDQFGREDQLVINIRGGDILSGVYSNYTLVPPEFYQFLVEITRLEPVFFGQLTESPYLEELRRIFPNAKFIHGRSAAFDFDFIRKSKNIVPCVSTFSWMASWLSQADRIFLPITGMLNPNQYPDTMLIPHNDPRYEFFLFPVNYALPVNEYRQYLDPIRGFWRRIPDRSIFCRSTPQKSLENYMLCFIPEDYIQMYPEKRSLYDDFGYSGLMNDFTTNGFWEGRHPCDVDPTFYTREHPHAALDIAMGRFLNPMHHYSEVGRLMGYKRRYHS